MGAESTTEQAGLAVALTDDQARWLVSAAAEATPPVSPGELLTAILDEAIGRAAEQARERAHQLKMYEASGYSEHHPDYPNIAGDRAR